MWLYQGKPFESEDIGDYLGFVYVITNLLNGKKYIGQKKFISSRTKLVKGKKKKAKTESDWKKYYGSNGDLQEDVKEFGKENFRREIIHLCLMKGEMNYKELKEQVVSDAILRPDEYYNGFLGGKINRKQLTRMLYSSSSPNSNVSSCSSSDPQKEQNEGI